jgi:hypothetical protein
MRSVASLSFSTPDIGLRFEKQVHAILKVLSTEPVAMVFYFFSKRDALEHGRRTMFWDW